jgi:hypothetical protein
MPRQHFLSRRRALPGWAQRLLFVMLLGAAGCTAKDAVSPVQPIQPTSLSPSMLVNSVHLDFWEEPELNVQDSDYMLESYDDAGLSRCPDEPHRGDRTIYLRGRILVVSATDPSDPNEGLIHFYVDADKLKFVRYIQQGSPTSRAAYTLTSEVLSEDLRFVAPPGAIAVMSCTDGDYVGNAGQIRTYVGKVKLLSIEPIIDTRLGLHSGCGNDPYGFQYDPYADSSTGSCSGGSDGGGDSGSGPQYRPGDYTGGETVNWQTGQGDGGTSVCGTAARVEYVCIDIWNGSDWTEWGCGYVTTC